MFSETEPILNEYHQLNLSEVIDFEKFNNYSITHHSTTIEGSALTEVETRLLLDEGITPAGKPLLHSLMVQDHYQALLFAAEAAKQKQPVHISFIQTLNAKIMRQTGSIYQTAFGEIDASKGMFRKGNVSAGATYFVNFDKVEKLVAELAETISGKMQTINTTEEQLNLAFDAHFDLVTIHPFYDGNGRTSRLLMNFIQLFFQLPPAIVFKEDKAAYFEALQDARKTEDISVFRTFMYAQYRKQLGNEIEKYKKLQSSDTKKGGGFSLVF
ncbi:MAG: Fic family protein [Chitinophagaceae bacterium]|nr:Fic family protein [Chitinophagaceae bacterium]